MRAASYRAGEPLHHEELGQTFDYSTRDDVCHTEIMLPEHAPDWAADREKLWNAVEQRENRKNSQFARALIIALPRELTLEQNVALMREHLQKEFVSKGMVADFAIHVGPASDKDTPAQRLPFDGQNPHAHVLVTLRGFNPDGTWQKHKERSLNRWNGAKEYTTSGDRPLPWTQRFSSADYWRAAWEKLQNAHLAAAGSDARVNMKSYRDQGIDRLPTIHMGPYIHAQEQAGERTDVGDFNRRVRAENAWREIAANDNRKPQADQDKIPAERRPANLPQHAIKPVVFAFRERAASNDNQPQDRRDPPPTPADAVKQKASAYSWDAHRRWLKDAVSGLKDYWGRQTDKMQRAYDVLTRKATYDPLLAAFDWGKNKTPDQREKEPAYRSPPRRVWSQEQRDDYRQLRPYLQHRSDLSKRDQAHMQARVMQYAQDKRDAERRAIMQKIALKQASYRYRSIDQDRPLPTRERTKGRGK